MWNRAAEELFDYAPAQVLGRNFLELVAARDRAQLTQNLEQAVAPGGLPPDGTLLELYGVKRDGSELPLELTFAPMSIGKHRHVVVVVRDISRRKRTEQAVMTATQEWQLTFDSLNDAVWLLDAEQRILCANRAAQEFFGMTVEQMLGRYCWEIAHQQTQSPSTCPIKKMKQSLRRESSEIQVGERWWRITVDPVLDPAGQLTGIVHVVSDITTSKAAETALRANEQQFRDLFEQSPNAVFVADANGKILAVNPAACQLQDLSREELVGKVLFNWVLPEKRAEMVREFPKWFTGAVHYSESATVTATGQILPVEVRGAPVTYRGQSAVLLHVYDISERLRVQESVRESEERFRAMFDNATEGILICDPQNHRFVSVNAAMCKMLGYEQPLEIEGLTPADLQPADGNPALTEVFARSKQPENWRAVNVPVKRKTGGVFYADINAYPITVLGRTYLCSLFHDVTERQRASEELRLSDERLREVVRQSHCLLWSAEVTAPAGWETSLTRQPPKFDWRFTIYDEEASRSLFRFAVDPNTTCPTWSTTRFPEDLALADANFYAAIRGAAKHYHNEFRWHDLDGKIRWMDEDTTVQRLDNWHWKVFGVAVDTTDRKTLEEQLRQSQKMHAVGQLAGGVAHDFNNLLNVTLGYCELLIQQTDLPGNSRNWIEEIHHAAERAVALTRQLLAFSRKQILTPKVFEVGNLLTNMSQMLQRLIGEHIRLKLATGTGSCYIKTDPNQLEQVLLNLCVNARDAMSNGGTLTIETQFLTTDGGVSDGRTQLPAGNYVVIAVTDTGVGMTPEVQEHLFEPFFTTKHAGKGTGLGLATCFGIIKQSGGEITVYSEVGRGTAIKIYLPSAHEALPAGTTPVALQIPRGNNETILLVEDEDSVRSLAATILSGLGYRVLEASNGHAALDLVAKQASQPIDLMLTDVVMPGMNGRELALRLATLRPGLKIIFTSGYTSESIVHLGILDPDVVFLPKPYTTTALAKKIRDVLDA